MEKDAQPPADAATAPKGAAGVPSIQAGAIGALIESVRDYAIFMLAPDGTVLTWNAGARAIKGYEASEIVGTSFERFYTPEDRASGKPGRLLRAAQRDGRVEDEGFRVRKDGSRFWADAIITAFPDGDGRLRGFVKVTRDPTERRAAEVALRASEERLRLMIDSVRDYAIYMLDPGGRVTSWNTGAERIKGYSAAEIIGKPFSIFYPEEDVRAGKPERDLELAARDGRVEDEGFRVRKSGALFWANCVISAMRDESGTLIGFAKVTRDLTERRRIEREVEEERGRLAEAQTAVKQRDEFISVAAHELRTPLTALQLKLEGLEAAFEKLPTEAAGVSKLTRRIDGAIRQTERLSGLVERLLDVSRIVAGKLEMRLEELDVSEVVREVVDDFREAAHQAGSEMVLTVEGRVTGFFDRTRLGQVMTNLLSNAVKYGESKPIDIRVAQDGPYARISVADRGIGISPQDIDRVFGRFERAAPLRNYSGLGLGLYIARYIVESHGGSVTVRSSAGAGSTFLIDLPLRPSMESARSARSAETSST